MTLFVFSEEGGRAFDVLVRDRARLTGSTPRSTAVLLRVVTIWQFERWVRLTGERGTSGVSEAKKSGPCVARRV